MKPLYPVLACVIMAGSACSSGDRNAARPISGAAGHGATAEITPGDVLDDFHDAASRADFGRYFGHMTADAVFLGTDATERWDRPAFEAYCRPSFAAGKGWTYRPHDRHIVFGPGSQVAWFDELLDNDSYGTCRGSGVLVRGADGMWRLAQYNLSVLIPNNLARDVVRMIRRAPVK
ncbi:MAG: nuclear transport factor 2 family protein [Phycisphaerales bacterium]|nr:nuclear transport factor 2 family protein [Phycisphaerales bacterium]